MKDIFKRVTITVTPKDRTDDFEIGVSGVDRVSITEISRDSNAGTIVIDVRGTKATPANKPNGDTTIEAKLDGHVCGSAQAIVIVPKSICGPCNSSGQAAASAAVVPPCPDGSHRDPENLVLDATTSPVWVGLPPGKVKLVTAWIVWVTMEICDQFDAALDELYEGCCVEEHFGGGNWASINQPLSANGTYQDPVFWYEEPANSVVNAGSPAANSWPLPPPPSAEQMGSSGCKGQDIQVQVCGHGVGGTGRKVCHRQDDPDDCVWVECPDGTIIV